MGWAILYTNEPAMGKMPAREEWMPKPAKKAKQAFWERGYLAHGYWLGKERLRQVKLRPKKERDGVYRREAGDTSREAAPAAGTQDGRRKGMPRPGRETLHGFLREFIEEA